MKPLRGKVLVIGYGNPGRLDDGLGPALAEEVSRWRLDHVTVESCYQLAVEHAEQVARYDVVIFADADTKSPEPFRFDRLTASLDVTFTTHSVAPEAILGLARQIFQAKTEGYIIGIRGYEFDDFGESLSPRARGNLGAAAHFLQSALQPTECEVGS